MVKNCNGQNEQFQYKLQTIKLSAIVSEFPGNIQTPTTYFVIFPELWIVLLLVCVALSLEGFEVLRVHKLCL